MRLFPGDGSRVQAANAPLQRRLNRQAVMDALLVHGPLPRYTLAAKTGLTQASISRIVEELLQEGLLAQLPLTGGPTQESSRSRARPGVHVDIDAESGFALSVHVGPRLTRVGVHDLRARPIASKVCDIDQKVSADEALRRVRAEAEVLAREYGVSLSRVIGLGVGVTAAVNDRGEIPDLIRLGWTDVPAAAILSSDAPYPVVVDRAQRGLAMAEAWFGAGVGVRSVAALLVSDVVGCGIVVDGRLMRGQDYSEGQVGHLTLPGGRKFCPVCGRVGCVEAEISDDATVTAAQDVLSAPAPVPDIRAVGGSESAAAVLRLHALARRGDQAARRLVAERGRNIAYVIALVSTLLDPTIMVLAGLTILDGWELMQPYFDDVLQAHRATPALHRTSEIRVTSFGPDATLVGAAALALRPFYINSNGVQLTGRRVARHVSSLDDVLEQGS